MLSVPPRALLPASRHDCGWVLMPTPAITGDPAVSHSDNAVLLLTWITLSRVADGSVIKQGETYLDGGAPLPPYLVASVPTLLTEGLLAVADPDPAGCHQLTLTAAGHNRYEELRRRGAGEADIS